jgi:hypothetical protein
MLTWNQRRAISQILLLSGLREKALRQTLQDQPSLDPGMCSNKFLELEGIICDAVTSVGDVHNSPSDGEILFNMLKVLESHARQSPPKTEANPEIITRARADTFIILQVKIYYFSPKS